MIAALLWKEWREQRWRCVLGTLVLTTISASLVRAQLVTTPEAVLITFGPLGLLLAIFLAMGSVATERADRTWTFLTAQPIRRAHVLRIKWLVGAIYLLVAFLIAGAAAHAAALSRGVFDIEPLPAHLWDIQFTVPIATADSAGWLWGLVALSMVAMLAWYTVLFFILTRARDELHAGLGGVLLTLACLAWLLQYWMSHGDRSWLGDGWHWTLWISSLLNPLSPIAFLLEPTAKGGFRHGEQGRSSPGHTPSGGVGFDNDIVAQPRSKRCEHPVRATHSGFDLPAQSRPQLHRQIVIRIGCTWRR